MAKSPLVLTVFGIQIKSTKYISRGIIRHHRLPVPKTLMNEIEMTWTLTIFYDFNIEKRKICLKYFVIYSQCLFLNN